MLLFSLLYQKKNIQNYRTQSCPHIITCKSLCMSLTYNYFKKLQLNIVNLIVELKNTHKIGDLLRRRYLDCVKQLCEKCKGHNVCSTVELLSPEGEV